MNTIKSSNSKGVIKRNSNAKKYDDVKKITHLFLHERFLKKIPEQTSPSHITTAYLHNNLLTNIENIDSMCSLTHLHLQWNRIEKIKGLKYMFCLKKLYLGNNCISVIENLESARNLEELHVEKQDFMGDDGLCFDPRSLMAIGETLKVIDVSENGLTYLSWVKPLRCLHTLIAKNNELIDFEEVADEICKLPQLRKVDFSGNPMTKIHRYRETLIARCPALGEIDGRVIAKNARVFIQGLDRSIQERKLLSSFTQGVDITPRRKSCDHQFGITFPGPESRSAFTFNDKKVHKKYGLAEKAASAIPKCFWKFKSPQPTNARASGPVAPPSWISGDFENMDTLKKESNGSKGVTKKIQMPMKYL